MWKLECDHCKKPIDQVGYQIRAVAAHDPEQVISAGPVVHWRCIEPYMLRDQEPAARPADRVEAAGPRVPTGTPEFPGVAKALAAQVVKTLGEDQIGDSYDAIPDVLWHIYPPYRTFDQAHRWALVQRVTEQEELGGEGYVYRYPVP
jgi:hypothetical protein